MDLPVRAFALAAFAVALLATTSAAQTLPLATATTLVTLAAPSAPDSSRPDPVTTVAAVRSAYQAAWDKRQAGDAATALGLARSGLETADHALARDLDAATHRELTELRSKLAGIADVTRHDLETPPPGKSEPAEASAGGEARGADAVTADLQVLNTPAYEDIEPQYNADVYRYIEYFTGTGRSVFERWLRRSGRYMALFREVLKKEGMPPDLVHLVFVESGFNVHARSVSAAVGPWQFLRSTGRLFGLTVNQWVDERKDPEKSTVAAARYLKHLYSIFGDWPLALASYNAGEGTVLRAIKRQGTTNYWDLKLPRQTEDYVPQFMAVLAISRDPQKYGFEGVSLEEPMNFDEIALKGAVDLRAIAKLADCRYEDLRDLNPAVLRHAAPGRDGVTMLRVPRGKAKAILAKLEGGVPLPAVDLTVKHRVRRGETLQGIANQYHVDARALARNNGVSRSRPLKRGMTLTVRSNLKSVPVQPAEIGSDDPRASTAYVPNRNLRPRTSLNADSRADGRVTVTVRRGETLAMIASRHGVTAEEIRRWNRLGSSTVRRGTRLKIRTGDAAVASAEHVRADSIRVASFEPPRGKAVKRTRGGGTTARRVVTVRAGDTLGAIASRHGTTVAQLRRANGLASSRIRAGQRLKIPA
jgi:peptidoglycan lytic transglycosylase D